MRTTERDIVAATIIAQNSTAQHRWPNIAGAERIVIKHMCKFDVGYNTVYKNYGSPGAVVSVKELSKKLIFY